VIFRGLAALVLALLTAQPAAAARSWNLYEWMAVAPAVAVGEVLVDDQPQIEVRVDRVIRGGLAVGQIALIDQRQANRERAVGTPRIQLEKGRSYLVLLSRVPPSKRASGERYEFVRGPAGAREVGEGGASLTEAAATLAAWQDRRDDALLWVDLARALEDPNPHLVEVALDMFVKFRRAGASHIPAIRLLLDAPRADFREKAALLAGNAAASGRGEPAPALREVVRALIAAARRDSVVVVRVAATRALGEIDDAAALEALREIARADPDQSVRYEAQRILVEKHAPASSDAIDLPGSAP
jgi:hypothetical protein